MNICILNASHPITTEHESDEYEDLRGGPAACFSGARILKKCRSWHSVAAALHSEFFVYKKPGWQGAYKYDAIIILVNHHIQQLLPLIKDFKLKNKKVIISYHENLDDWLQQTSPYQNSDHPVNVRWHKDFISAVELCDGICTIMHQSAEMFEWLYKKPILRLCHALPWTEWQHGLTVPIAERKGILVGTRTLNQRLRRNTLASLMIASRVAEINSDHGCRVTYLDEDKLPAGWLQSVYGLSNNIDVIQGPLPYEEWIGLIAKHRMVFQHDQSSTLGQVVSDSLLVSVPCIGGNSDYATLLGWGSPAHVDGAYKHAVWAYRMAKEKSDVLFTQEKNYKEMTSFEAVRSNIERFFKLL